MKKKFLVITLTLVLAISLLAGCGKKDEASVYWLNFKPESDEVLQKIAEMYTEETGVPVKVLTAASGTYDTTLTSEMEKSEPPTMFVIGSAPGVKTWGDYALDLTDTAIAKELTTDAYNLYDADGKLVSIGYCYECYGIIVNVDLLEQAGHKLDEITNFASLKAVAEDIHGRAAELGFDAFTSNDMDSSSSWRYTGHMINLDYYYEEKAANTTWTATPDTITGAYVDNFRMLYDLAVNNSTVARADLATGGHDAEGEFCKGKAVFFVQGNWEWPAIQAAGLTNVTMIPYYCGVEGEEKAGLNCGTANCWAINSKASEADQKATMDFLVWCVTDPEASRMLVDSFGVMPYKKAAESTNPFLKVSEDYANKGCYIMDWATNYQPDVDNCLPVVSVAVNSFKKNTYVKTDTFALPNEETSAGFDNFVTGMTFGKYPFWKSVAYSTVITVFSTLLIVLFTSMAAWYIARVNSKICKLIYYLCVFSMVVPFQMVMYPLSKTADRLQLNTPWSIPIVYLGFGAGLAIFMFVGFVKSIPLEIEEAAAIDGCGPVMTFFKVVFPMLRPTMISVGILEIMWVWNDYLLPALVLDLDKYRTIPIHIQYLKGSYGTVDLGATMALIFMSIVPVIVFYLVCQKYIIKGVAAGAVKG